MMRSVRLLAGTVLTVVLAMAMTSPAHATVTTITPSNADTYLDEYNAGANYGGETRLEVFSFSADGENTNYRSLVKFDLSSIPLGSTINTASLQLYYYAWSLNNPVGRTYTANRVITNDWADMTATWNKYDGANSWGTAGGDYTTTGGASQTVPAAYGYMTWDVTAIVKAWMESGQPNYGFLIRDQVESAGGVGASFYSREQALNRPILTVDYTGPAPPPVPVGAVGGVVIPLNTFAILGPWLAVIGLVGCIGTAVVVAKKLRA